MIMNTTNNFALECISQAEAGHTFQLHKQGETDDYILEQFNNDELFITKVGKIASHSGLFFGTTDKYEFFSSNGEKDILEVFESQGIQTCRAVVCPGDKPSITAKLSISNDSYEYFKCL